MPTALPRTVCPSRLGCGEYANCCSDLVSPSDDARYSLFVWSLLVSPLPAAHARVTVHGLVPSASRPLSPQRNPHAWALAFRQERRPNPLTHRNLYAWANGSGATSSEVGTSNRLRIPPAILRIPTATVAHLVRTALPSFGGARSWTRPP